MKVLVAGLLDLSSVDYPKRPAAVIFTPKCNYNCPFCQNWKILKVKAEYRRDLNDILEFIDRASPTIEAVKVTGGEPTLYPYFLKEVGGYTRKKGLRFGFDTNGFLHEAIKELTPYSDLISLDLKTVPTNSESMERLIGMPGKGEKAAENTMKTLKYLMHHDEVYLDLRTTVVPTLNDDTRELEVIGEILKSLDYESRASQGSASYTLQEFVPEHAREESIRRIRSPSPKDLAKLADASHLEHVYVKHRDVGFMVHRNELSHLIPSMG
jgi:pyruvate formate lyase activating enzyme